VRDLTHLWQRFLLASSLVVGLLIGVALTVFGYGNRTAVDVHWSVFHVDGVPLWMVAIVPLAIVLVAGTVYHWMDGLHHFTEHMRHRHRVHELEAEVASLRAHLDQVLDMPDHSTTKLPPRSATVEPVPVLASAAPTKEVEAVAETLPAVHRRLPRPKRVTLAVAAEPAAIPTINGGRETAPVEPAH
jgi:cytochrome bd-type quinol oxidase subunit 2